MSTSIFDIDVKAPLVFATHRFHPAGGTVELIAAALPHSALVPGSATVMPNLLTSIHLFSSSLPPDANSLNLPFVTNETKLLKRVTLVCSV